MMKKSNWKRTNQVLAECEKEWNCVCSNLCFREKLEQAYEEQLSLCEKRNRSKAVLETAFTYLTSPMTYKEVAEHYNVPYSLAYHRVKAGSSHLRDAYLRVFGWYKRIEEAREQDESEFRENLREKLIAERKDLPPLTDPSPVTIKGWRRYYSEEECEWFWMGYSCPAFIDVHIEPCGKHWIGGDPKILRKICPIPLSVSNKWIQEKINEMEARAAQCEGAM